MSGELQLYTAAEVADLLRMNQQVIQRKLQAGEIPGYRIGREWRVERAQLFAWLEQHSNQRDPTDNWFRADGSLKSIPVQRAKRDKVLHRIARAVVPDRTYKERELNAVLRDFHDDVATLRRDLVANKLLIRSADGVYKRKS